MQQQEEIWKDIPGYEGLYQVSNLGNVKSLQRIILIRGKYPSLSKEKILNTCKNKYGYLKLSLYKNGKKKSFEIHVLMAMAFLNHKPCGHKLVVDHIDNVPLNNVLSNLQIITQRENSSKDVKNKTSKYSGVYWDKGSKKWKTGIQINGLRRYLGYFVNEIDASKAYNEALNNFEKNGVLPPEIQFSSKYKGVSWDKKVNKWRAGIKIKGKSLNLGNFTNELDASNAYQNKLQEIKQLN